MTQNYGQKQTYTFMRIKAPEANKQDLASFTRKVNEQFEALTTKLYGYLEYNDLSAKTQNLIIDATLKSAQYVQDLAAKAGIGDLAYVGTSAPESPVEGKLWLDISVVPNQFKRWNGTGWDDAGGSSLLDDLMAEIPYSSIENGDLRTLLENVSHNVNGIVLTGLGGLLKLILGPGGIYFNDSGEIVAYITGQVMHITSIEVDSIKIGGATLVKTENGFFIK